MRSKAKFVVAAGIACLLVFDLSAFATPLPRARPPIERLHLPERHAGRTYVQRVVDATRSVFGSSGSALVAEARKYMGTNPTDRKRLWCATFMNFILAKLGYAGTDSDAAKSFTDYGRRIHGPRVGAIAVLTRGKRGGHVGVVSGIDAHGNPIIISGNHNRRVGVAVYPRSRVIAYVLPTRREARHPRVAASAPVSRAPEHKLDSPITELLAAINAETNRAEARATRREAAHPRLRREMRRREVRTAQPYRLVQQTPDQVPLDPALAKLLGIRPEAGAKQAHLEVQR